MQAIGKRKRRIGQHISRFGHVAAVPAKGGFIKSVTLGIKDLGRLSCRIDPLFPSIRKQGGILRVLPIEKVEIKEFKARLGVARYRFVQRNSGVLRMSVSFARFPITKVQDRLIL